VTVGGIEQDTAERTQDIEIIDELCFDAHTVADDYGDPEVLLENLNAAEAETAALRDQLKTILAEALAR
jgi:hypothetical protein